MHLHPPIRPPFRPFPIWESTNNWFSHFCSNYIQDSGAWKNFSKFSQSTSAIPLFLGAPPRITRAHIGRLWATRSPAGRPAEKSTEKICRKNRNEKKKKKFTETKVFSAREISDIAFSGGPAFPQYCPAGKLFGLLLPTAAHTCKKSLKSPR